MLRRSSGVGNLSIDDKTRLDEMVNLIDQATSDILNSVDWSANMQLVDQINATGNIIMLREVVRHTRKRLQMKIPRIIMNSLTLIETLVMNCHTKFQQEVATEKFMESMIKVVKINSIKYDDISIDIYDKSLSIIQSWGLAFVEFYEMMPLFVDTYQTLLREGFSFPKDDELSAPPVLTPQASLATSPSSSLPILPCPPSLPSSSASSTYSSSSSTASIFAPDTTSSSSAMDPVAQSSIMSANLSIEVLSQLLSNEKNIIENELGNELNDQCLTSLNHLRSLIENPDHCENISELLDCYERLNKVMEDYRASIEKQTSHTSISQTNASNQKDIKEKGEVASDEYLFTVNQNLLKPTFKPSTSLLPPSPSSCENRQENNMMISRLPPSNDVTKKKDDDDDLIQLDDMSSSSNPFDMFCVEENIPKVSHEVNDRGVDAGVSDEEIQFDPFADL